MVEGEIIKKIENDFAFIKNHPEIIALILFGSYASGQETSRSDIDICLVVPNKNLYEIHKFISKNLNIEREKYDIRFFEELPLYIKADIIENGVIIFTEDRPSLFEYFYHYIKLWEDQKYKLRILST